MMPEARGATNFQIMYNSQYNPTLQNKLDEEKQVYTNNESFADLANRVQTKVNEMTGEMNDKSDELDNQIEEINQAKQSFEDIESELDELINQINDMGDYESRIDEAVSEADRLLT